jgi:hemolysin type calcium-binding protein
MRHLVALAALSSALLSPVALIAPASAVGETCDGHAATMVGTPGSTITGTDGPDVIVSAGAAEVLGNGGDDIICTTLSGPDSASTLLGSVRVLAGPGNDLIDRRGDTDPQAYGLVVGDAGQDTILGAPGMDGFNVNDGERDVVSTGAGNDSGTDEGLTISSPDPDVIDLGPGDDAYSAGAPFSSELSVTGGDGVDGLSWTLPDNGTFKVDATAGQFLGPQQVVQSFTGIEDFDAYSRKHAKWSFVGSGAGERLRGSTHDLTSAVMGGGDDMVQLRVGRRPATVPVNGGPGRDLFQADATLSRIDVDLLTRSYQVADGPSGRLSHFEDAEVYGDVVRLTGSRKANTLTAVGCASGRIDADRGDDVATIFVERRRRCDGGRQQLLGGPGDDLLTGSRLADLIDGGPGKDTADGMDGRDTCRSVETRTSCERR